jgi:hypothetical protein
MHSVDILLTVVEPQQLPPEQYSGIPIEYLYGGATVIIIIVVTDPGYLLMKKHKTKAINSACDHG